MRSFSIEKSMGGFGEFKPKAVVEPPLFYLFVVNQPLNPQPQEERPLLPFKPYCRA